MKKSMIRAAFAGLLLCLSVLVFGQNSVLYTADFTSLASYSYTANKTVTLNSKDWTISASQAYGNPIVFYLGCNNNNNAIGIINSTAINSNGQWNSTIAALSDVDSYYASNVSTAHAYAMMFDNAYNNVSDVHFEWDGGNNAFLVYLFGDTGNGLTLLASSAYTAAIYNVGGSVDYTFPTNTNVQKFVIVARPGTATNGAASKTLRAHTFTINGIPDANTVATPIITPVCNSTVFTPQQVSITCATDGAAIYYTTDGSTPNTNATLYTGPFTVSQTTTIKAIATYPGYSNSNIAIATYNFPIQVATISDFKEMTSANSSTSIQITEDVTFVYKSGAYMYVKDATDGLLVYDNTIPSVISTTYEEGDQITGLAGTRSVFRNQIELVPSTNTAPATANTGAVAPIVVTLADLQANYEQYDAQLITLEDITLPNGFTGETQTQFSQNGTNCVIYNRFNLDTTIAAGTVTDLTGFAAIYNNDIQIYPRYNADLAPAEPIAPQPSITIAAPTNGTTLSTLDTLQVALNINNFDLGTDGLLMVDCPLLSAAGMSSPVYMDAATYNYFMTQTFSPLPAGTYTATVALVNMDHTPLTPAVSATTTFSVVAPTIPTPSITATGESAGTANHFYFTADVTIAEALAGTDIYYTLDGTTPDENAMLYTEPFEVTSSCIVKAIAMKEYYANSGVASTMITIDTPTVATPVIMPAAGTYADSVSVSITCATENALIRYTTDGTEPTSTSTVYANPFTLTNNATVSAKAFKTDWHASETATATYHIAHEAALAVTPSTLSFTSTTLTNTIDVTSAFLTEDITLTCENEHFTLSQNSIPAATTAATITITFDGTASTTGIVTLTSDTLTAQVVLQATAQLPTPAITPASGSEGTNITVTITDSNEDAEIYYTLDGTAPTIVSTMYDVPFTLSTPGNYTVKAIAVLNGWENSTVATATYTVLAPIPQLNDTLAYYTGFEPEEGFTLGNQYNNADEALNGPANQEWGIVYGTISTTTPIFDTASLQMRWYTSAASTMGYARTNFDITHATRIQFHAKSTGNLNVIASYSTDGGNNYVDSLFTLSSNDRVYNLVVSETAAYDNVRFKFTVALPETAPSSTSRVCIDSVCIYNFPSLISGTVATPVISPNSTTLYDTTAVSITCATQGADIYYTTDGSMPNENSTLYNGPFDVTATTTVKAIAMKASFTNSNVASATYTFPIEVTNIAAFKAANSATNSTVYKITGDVTFVYEHGANFYIQDATGGLLIYDNQNVIDGNYSEGDIIRGGVYGTYTLYNGLVELVPTRDIADASGATETINPLVLDVEAIEAQYNQYESRLVTLQGVTFTEGGTFTTSSATNMNIEQNGENMQVRNNFKTLDMTIPAGYVADVTGFILSYTNNSTGETAYQIAPRDNNDIAGLMLDSVATPVIEIAPLTNNMYMVVLTCETEGATIYYTTDGSNPDATANEYASNFAVEGGSTIKAMAMKEGMANSAIAIYENTGIQDFNGDVITIFPNPTSGNCTLLNTTYTIQSVSIYDIYGQLLSTEAMNDFNGSLDFSSFAPGTYFLRISTDKGMATKKIVVRR